MDQDRWREVSRVYGAVLTRPREARAAALDQLCGEDAALRREVESLLREEAASIDQPASVVASSLVSEDLSGRTLGVFRLEALLGAGGMGQVYRATDTRLQRTVAIKVLPPSLADDPQFRARFDREAKAIGALNHPHICTLYDVGHIDAVSFLVMEYVEGETLAARLAHGAIPFAQALSYAIEIAEALAAAHKLGIVHRDLKPGNVMVTKAGTKLLDFGLAKTTASAAVQSLSLLPTTPPNRLGPSAPLTAQGAILGTFQYMAPEQIEGRDADVRTDVFAFGALVYELLTGKKAFEGKSQASLIGAIMHAEPAALTTLQPVAPALLDRIVKKCLAKHPDDRWQSAHDVASELDWIRDSAKEADESRLSGRGRSSPVARALPWTLAALLAIVALIVWSRRVSPTVVAEPSRVIRATILPPRDVAITGLNPPDRLGLSPDGRYLAFVGIDLERVRHLWIRSLDSATAEMLPGTENAMSPFWSPDGKSIGFFASGRLKKMTIPGGPALTICALPGVEDGDTRNFIAGGTWNSNGVIVFSLTSDGRSQLYRIGTDGKPQRIGEGDLPFFFPDGDHFVYRLSRAPIQLKVGMLSGGDSKVILEGNVTQTMFANGFLIFVRDQALLAQAFDQRTLTLQGDVHVLASPVLTGTGIRSAFSVSQADVIAYQAFTVGEPSQLQWVDSRGIGLGIVGETNNYGNVSLSHDGKRVVASIWEDVNVLNDIWLFDSSHSGPPVRLVRTPNINEDTAAWSHRNDRIAYAAAGSGQNRLVIKAPNPAANVINRLSGFGFAVFDWSPDDRAILGSFGEAGVSLVEVEGGAEPESLKLPRGSNLATFSPDGHWIAYQSRESGRGEVYIVPAPGRRGEKVALSIQSGWPRWRPDGKALFFLSGANQDLMIADIHVAGDSLTADVPKRLFGTRLKNFPGGWPYDVAPDGRFLMNLRIDAETAPPAMILANWTTLIRGGQRP